MRLTPRSIVDWRERELKTPRGYLTFRRYTSGWLLRFVPFDPADTVEKIEEANARAACDFANERLTQQRPDRVDVLSTNGDEYLSRRQKELD